MYTLYMYIYHFGGYVWETTNICHFSPLTEYLIEIFFVQASLGPTD